MENLNDAKFYANKIVSESRHKFIYSYNDNRKLLIEELKKYPITVGNDYCALYYNIDSLPKFDSGTPNSKDSAISIISDQYLCFSLASKIIDSILSNNDLEMVNQREYILLNYINQDDINSINSLLNKLRENEKMYHEIYLTYMKQGVLLNPSNESSFPFMELYDFISYVKKMLEKKINISLVFDHQEDVFLESYKTINNIVASRINADISANILTEPDSWKTYYAQNGQMIESTHDYESIEYDDSSYEYLLMMKNKYQRKWNNE